MLTIKVNGCVKKLNIGCRTCVSLDALLKILEAGDQKITLNGKTICRPEFDRIIVNGGDSLGLD